jgi:hypothetical protein
MRADSLASGAIVSTKLLMGARFPERRGSGDRHPSPTAIRNAKQSGSRICRDAAPGA